MQKPMLITGQYEHFPGVSGLPFQFMLREKPQTGPNYLPWSNDPRALFVRHYPNLKRDSIYASVICPDVANFCWNNYDLFMFWEKITQEGAYSYGFHAIPWLIMNRATGRRTHCAPEITDLHREEFELFYQWMHDQKREQANPIPNVHTLGMSECGWLAWQNPAHPRTRGHDLSLRRPVTEAQLQIRI